MKLFYEEMSSFLDLAEFVQERSQQEIAKEVALAHQCHRDKNMANSLKQESDRAKILEKIDGSQLNLKGVSGMGCYAFASPVESMASVGTFLRHLKNNIAKFIQSYDLLQDQESKDTYFYMLLFRLMPYDLKFLEKIRCMGFEYYQKELLPAKEGEVFLDCGAYDGLTAIEFTKAYGKTKAIYSFEPVPSNFQLLVKNVKHMEEVHCLNKGVADKEGSLNFVNGANGSRCYPKGDIVVSVVTIDEEIKEPVTFVKMDIEGFEMPALKGCENHLKTDRPFLAICVYHLISDFYKIPLYLSELLPDYVFNLRHHGDLDWAAPQYGTVLYGCPKEKLQGTTS